MASNNFKSKTCKSYSESRSDEDLIAQAAKFG